IGNRGIARVAEDVLAPYRNVDASFRTTIVSLQDGRVLTGLVRQNADPSAEESLTLLNSEAKETVVPRSEIEEQSTSPLSIMPDNFLQTLTEEDRRNLFAFLLNLK
ncbi:MAG: hypothetical protein KDB23_18190, partial [Planctomycetales bacterium]|nr:hypothetical protein [Planctomycetales bacterium]